MNRPILTRARALGTLAATLPAVSFASPLRAQTPQKLRLGAVAADTYGEFYYALDANSFAKAGFDVEITTFTNGAAMAAAAAGGSIDAGTGDVVATVNAIGHGVPFVLLAGGGLYTSGVPTTLLCVAKNAPIANAKGLEGQTVAVVSLVSLSSAAVKAWITAGGGDVSKVKFIELPFAQMGAAVARGTVAAALIAEPALTAASADVQTLGKAYDAVAPEFLISIVFATRDWVAKNPEASRRFVRVLYDMAKIANAHPEATAPILAKYTKLDMDHIHAMKRSQYATALVPAQLQPVLDIAAKYKVLDRSFNAADLIAGKTNA